jgi:3-phenylpropionate/trans-cinnamate dioxygenase ferredoxin reductase subunit
MHYDYDFVIVGGGMVADAAAKGIREQGSSGSIGIVGEERTAPFPRPALSKKLWTDPDFTFEDAALDTAEETSATLHLGTPVTSVSPDTRTVTTSAGDTFGYGRLLLATGGRPRRLDGLDPSERVLYFRTLQDYQRLRELSRARPEVVVVGGGYIGSEIAAALSQHDCPVTIVHPDQVLGGAMFPPSLADSFQARFDDAGVRRAPGMKVTSGQQDGEHVVVHLSDGSSIRADVVVIGLGIEPAGDVADGVVRRSEDGGIVVDEHLRTSVADIYAAGDVAEYPDRILGRRRVEHVDNADSMGGAVGRIMAGSEETYDHTPMFYSDVLGLGYEAVGTLDSSLETVLDPVDDSEGGMVVFYLDDTAVRGVLLWDGAGDLDAARELLARGDRPEDASTLRGSVR